MKATVGQWVRFYRNGALVIGVVQYVRVDPVNSEREYQTDNGAVDEDGVLEVR
jgi:hypothetical protein